MVMVTVQTRNRHELCGVFGRSNTLEDCNEAAAATHRTKVDQSKAKARKGGHVKAILPHIELTLERRGRRWWPWSSCPVTELFYPSLALGISLGLVRKFGAVQS